MTSYDETLMTKNFQVLVVLVIQILATPRALRVRYVVTLWL